MTIDLGNGNSVTINAFHGQTWLMVQSRGASIGVALDNKPTMDVAGELIAAVRGMRRVVAGRA